jgi:hypothetical protein
MSRQTWYVLAGAGLGGIIAFSLGLDRWFGSYWAGLGAGVVFGAILGWFVKRKR